MIFEKKKQQNNNSSLENRAYDRMDMSRWPSDPLYPQTLTLTSQIGGGRLVVIVRSRTKATELVSFSSVTIKHLLKPQKKLNSD
jgi:hypothetical protein